MRKILLVEDQILIAISETQQLESFGYTVSHVTNGEDAVKAAVNEQIDLILMDIDLGDGIDGTQAAEKILEIIDIPIVFLSSHTESEIVEKTEEITSYGYVVKDSGPVVLDASIKMAIRLFNAKQELKLSASKLKINEENIKNITDAMQETVSVIGLDGTFLYSNKNAASNMSGGKSEDISGRNIKELIPEEQAESFIKTYKSVQSSGKPFQQEVEVALKTGNTWFYNTLKPIKFGNDKIPAVLSVSQDITDRKTSEIKLKQETLRLESIIEGTNVGTWEWNVQTGETVFDERWAEIIGYSLEEISPVTINTWKEFTHPEDFKLSNELLQKHFAGELPYYECEARMRHKNGEWVWILDRGKIAEWTDEGEPLRVMGTHQDITGQKHAEYELKESEQKFKSVFDMSLTMMCIADINTATFQLVNPSFSRILGYTAEELLSKPFFEFIHPDDIEPIMQVVNEELKAGKKVINFKNRYRCKDGTYRLIDWNSHPVPEKGITYAVGHDITELKQAEIIIQKQLEEKELLLKELHHRVKNNIANIGSFLRLQSFETDNTEVKNALTEAYLRVSSINNLYEKLLFAENHKDVSVKSYLEGFIDSVIEVFDLEGKVVFETQISDFNIESSIAVTVGIIINELLTNTVKYAFKGCDDCVISVQAAKEKNKITLLIADNGIGFEAGVIKEHNSGFGMNLVKMLVDQLQGTLNIENDGGAKIKISFEI